jgi:hypothetical protein
MCAPTKLDAPAFSRRSESELQNLFAAGSEILDRGRRPQHRICSLHRNHRLAEFERSSRVQRGRTMVHLLLAMGSLSREMVIAPAS